MSPFGRFGHDFRATASSLRTAPRHGFLRNPFSERWSTFLMHALIRLFSLPLSHRLVSWLSAPRRPVPSLAALALVFFASVGGMKAAVPTDIGLTSVTITQSTATVGTTIATLSTLDADVGDTHTYSLVLGPGSTNNGSFAIVGATLRVGPVALNAGSYTLRLRTTDSTANNYEEIVIITVTDNVQPVITGTVAPNNASYAAGAQLIFTAYFSEPVTVSTVGGTPRIALTLDTGGTVFATYLAGSGSLAISFRYIVQPGERSRTEGVGGLGPHRLPDLREWRHAHERLGRGDDEGGAQQGCGAEADGIPLLGRGAECLRRGQPRISGEAGRGAVRTGARSGWCMH